MADEVRVADGVEARENLFLSGGKSGFEVFDSGRNVGDFGVQPRRIVPERQTLGIADDRNVGGLERPVDIAREHRLVRVQVRVGLTVFAEYGGFGKASLEVHRHDGALRRLVAEVREDFHDFGFVGFLLFRIGDRVEIVERGKVERVHERRVRLFVPEFVAELLYEHPGVEVLGEEHLPLLVRVVLEVARLDERVLDEVRARGGTFDARIDDDRKERVELVLLHFEHRRKDFAHAEAFRFFGKERVAGNATDLADVGTVADGVGHAGSLFETGNLREKRTDGRRIGGRVVRFVDTEDRHLLRTRKRGRGEKAVQRNELVERERVLGGEACRGIAADDAELRKKRTHLVLEELLSGLVRAGGEDGFRPFFDEEAFEFGIGIGFSNRGRRDGERGRKRRGKHEVLGSGRAHDAKENEGVQIEY